MKYTIVDYIYIMEIVLTILLSVYILLVYRDSMGFRNLGMIGLVLVIALVNSYRITKVEVED